MDIRQLPANIIFLSLLFFTSCQDALWNGDLENYVENGSTQITLKNTNFSPIPSGEETTIELPVINPRSLDAEYTLIFEATPLASVSFNSDSAHSHKKLFLTVTTTEEAEGESLDFTLNVSSAQINRTFPTRHFSLLCDTKPNRIKDLVVGATTDEALTVAAFLLPSQSTDDDIEFIEISYNLTGSSAVTTVKIDAHSDSYKNFASPVDFAVESNENLRYFSPPEAQSAELYDFSISLIDEHGQYSEEVMGSNGTTYYYISYSADGGTWSNDPGSFYIEEGQEITLPTAEDLSRDSYELKAWIDEDSNTYPLGETITVDKNMNFIPQWEGLLQIHYYNIDGNINTSETGYGENEPATILFTATHTGDSPAEGYVFAGWSTEATVLDEPATAEYYDAVSGTDSTDLTLGTEDVSLYPVWVPGTPLRTPEELYALYDGMTADYYLARDIDLDPTVIDSSLVYGTIGTFTGNFYGWEHSLSNLSITTTADYYGLFGILDGTVSNLTLSDVTFSNSSYSYVGIMSGVQSGTVQDCDISGTMTVADDRNGGFTGRLDSSGIIQRCTGSLLITTLDGSTPSYLGGIAGECVEGDILDSTFTGTIESHRFTGGIVGWTMNSTIDNCTLQDLTMSHSDEDDGQLYIYIGGVAGYAEDSTLSDNTCQNISLSNTSSDDDSGIGGLAGGSINGSASGNNLSNITISGGSATYRVGGLIGNVEESDLSSNTVTTLSIDGTGNYSGGLIGYLLNCSVSDSHVSYPTMSTDGSYTGGLIAYAEFSSSSTITACTVNMTPEDGNSYTIESTGNDTGGFIGLYDLSEEFSPSISESAVYGGGTITSSGTFAGGFIGRISGPSTVDGTLGSLLISQSYAQIDLNVTGSYPNQGGFIGKITEEGPAVTVENSYSRGTLHTADPFTNASGFADTSSFIPYWTLTLKNCYTTAEIDDGSPLGLMEDTGSDYTSQEDSYYLSDSTIANSLGINLNSTGFMDNTSLGWEESIWGWDDEKNNGYPYLKALDSTY
ncbi:MAG: InlB B-repeat-containing protein [Spirochaetales bacterium]|nr:InlB B-repeat-containing protein [Spirochaetales bacterium]